jgi:hypothetical protein
MPIPNKLREKLTTSLKRMVPVIINQKTRDISEADTVTIVKDVLSEVFGYDKYADLTGELGIRGTSCDIAIKLDDKLAMLVEVKAIGIELQDRHVKQAIDYASNQGIEWAILTNGAVWRLYHVIFAKPIDKRLLVEVDLQALDPKDECDLERLYPFTKEGFRRDAHVELRDRQDATSRFVLAALLLKNESVIAVVRRELRRVVDVLVGEEEILKALRDEVIKQSALEGPEFDTAVRRVNRKAERAITNRPDIGVVVGKVDGAVAPPQAERS